MRMQSCSVVAAKTARSRGSLSRNLGPGAVSIVRPSPSRGMSIRNPLFATSILTCRDLLISSTEWWANPFFSSSLAQVAADFRSGAIASNDTIDFMSSSSFASLRTWARNCVVVFPSSATS